MESKCVNCGSPLATENIDGHEVVFCVTCGDPEPEADDAN